MLISQKYPKEIVTQEIKKELIILFEVLHSEKAKESKHVLHFISTHNPNDPNLHCVKSVQIRRFFWSVFSHIWSEYGEIRSIQSECGKIRTRKTSVFGHLSRSAIFIDKKNIWHFVTRYNYKNIFQKHELIDWKRLNSEFRITALFIKVTIA